MEGKKKLFISIPMLGRTDEDVKKDIDIIYNKWFATGDYEIIDQIVTDPSWSSTKCIGHSIMLMADADIVVMANGWENARGCKIEKEVCDKYGIKVVTELDLATQIPTHDYSEIKA